MKTNGTNLLKKLLVLSLAVAAAAPLRAMEQASKRARAGAADDDAAAAAAAGGGRAAANAQEAVIAPGLVEAKGPQVQFPGVKKINDNVYVGKVANELGGFFVGMERITSKNIEGWWKYAQGQNFFTHKAIPKYLPDLDAMGAFHRVLEDYRFGKIICDNELWIAYASQKEITGDAVFQEDRINQSIDMFVTVISSPEALLTSHMGISRTREAAEDFIMQDRGLKKGVRKKHPQQSLHLHSFAAKVMLLQNPKRTYMLTTPLPAMRKIFIGNLPDHSVFIGDDFYQRRLLTVQSDKQSLLSEEEKKIKKGESHEAYNERLKTIIEFRYNFGEYEEGLSMLKSHPPRIFESLVNLDFTITNPDGTFIIFKRYSTKIYQWLNVDIYTPRGTRIPYVLVDLAKLAEFGALEQYQPGAAGLPRYPSSSGDYTGTGSSKRATAGAGPA